MNERLLSLSDIFYGLQGSKMGGISMPTLIKYKKQHARRDGLLGPFVRETAWKEDGTPASPRKMRFTTAAVPIFMKLRKEGEKRRGRPRKVRA